MRLLVIVVSVLAEYSVRGHPFSNNSTEPVCLSSNDCPADKACSGTRCGDPCTWACGLNTVCQVFNHVPVCACAPGYSGQPLTGCDRVHECMGNDQCPEDRACVQHQCVDPCPGVCAANTLCQVRKHYPACACPPGFQGNPFSGCQRQSKDCSGLKKYHLDTSIKMNWYDAFRHCQVQGGRLATILSREENDRVIEIIQNNDKGINQFWLGGSVDGRPLRDWHWMTTGRPIDGFTAFRYGQPDNLFGVQACLDMWELEWDDENCLKKLPFICEHCE